MVEGERQGDEEKRVCGRGGEWVREVVMGERR